MKKIKIQIPDNLSPEEEALEIGKQLASNRLLGNSSNLLLGSGYEVKHMTTQIEVERIPVEDTIETCKCEICKTEFEKKLGKKVYHNYGGNRNVLLYCSDTCRDTVMNFLGLDRCSKTAQSLPPVRKFY